MKRSLLLLVIPLGALAAELAPLDPVGGLYTYHVGSLANSSGAAGAYFMPASLAYDSQPFELEAYGSLESEDHEEYDDFAVFGRAGNLGFGVRHVENMGGGFSNNYRLGLGFGDRQHMLGFNYGWSVGDDDGLKQADHFQISSIEHYNRWVSSASNATFLLGEDYGNSKLIYEEALALRPWTERLTLTADFSWMEDSPSPPPDRTSIWLGAAVEPLDGLRLSGRRNMETADMTFAGTVYWRGFGLGALNPLPDDDQIEAGRRWHAHLSAKELNRWYPVRPKRKIYAQVDLKGVSGEFEWLNVASEFRLMDFFEQMDAAQEDPRVKGVLVNWHQGFRADLGMLYEIRERLEEFKEQGGEVVFYSHHLSLGSLYLASIADRRAMLPIGQAEIGNFGRERIYLADALEEAGLDFVRFNVGAYKGAGETLDLNHMSDEVRENIGRLLNELYDYLLAEIQDGFGFSAAQMDRLTEVWFQLDQDLVEMGIVDTLVYDDQLEDWVCHRSKDGEGSSTFSLGPIKFNIEKKEKSGGGERVVSLPALKPNKIRRKWADDREIAVIYASGLILSGESVGPFIIGHETLVEQLKQVREDGRIKAVILYIDSPGGSGYASDLVWREMERLTEEKPFLVSHGFIAGSGGYYLSMAADTILSTPLTITGSIGVAAGVFIGNELLDNTRIRQDGVWAGKKESLGGAQVALPLNIDAGSAQVRLPSVPVFGHELTSSQDREIRRLIRDFYDDFVQKVADGRDMEFDEVHQIAEGRVWSGGSARELGLVDELGGLREAIELAKQRIGKAGKDVSIREYFPGFSWEQLLRLLKGGMGGGLAGTRAEMEQEAREAVQQARLDILGSGRPELISDVDLLDLE